MSWILKKVLTALVLPPAGPILIAALGLLMIRRWPRSGKALAWGGLLALWIFTTPIVGFALLGQLEDLPPLDPAQMKQAQAIVVLSGGSYFAAPEYGGDTVGAPGLERIRYAAHLARQSRLPVLVTGGAPMGGKPESEAMRDALEKEFDVRVRWTEAKSFDTAQNASFSAPILRGAGIKRILLVSHALHMRRARAAFEQEGIEVIPAPTAYSTRGGFSVIYLLPGSYGLRLNHLALHEMLGILVQRLTQ